MMNYLLPLDTNKAKLENCGGKGLNLCILASHGIPVPDAFIVTTAAYLHHVREIGLEKWISDEIQANDDKEMHMAKDKDDLSCRIRERFRASKVSNELRDQISKAYKRIDHSEAAAVAVRSSATAEDLPDLSFAGQQDTFLNVIGIDAVINAVIECWASLWNTRAIEYRDNCGVGNTGLSLAVVVQQMIPSQTSGVLFTANCVTGDRQETIIDSTWGLGEALVSGFVVPDHFRVSRYNDPWRVCERTRGSKAVLIQGKANGGTETIKDGSKIDDSLTLTDEQVIELAKLGELIEAIPEYNGTPQDIEWGIDPSSKIHILQARPITSLYPPLLSKNTSQGQMWSRVGVSIGHIQGVLEPFSPCGQDMLRNLAIGLGSIFGYPDNILESDFKGVCISGYRLYAEVSNILRHQDGTRIIGFAASAVDSGVSANLKKLRDDERVLRGVERRSLIPRRFRMFKTFFPLLRKIGPIVLYKAKSDPDAWRENLFSQMTSRLITDPKEVAALNRDIDSKRNGVIIAASSFIDDIRKFSRPCVKRDIPLLVGTIITGYRSLLKIGEIIQKYPDLVDSIQSRGKNIQNSAQTSTFSSLVLLQGGMPHNITSMMDLELWRLTERIYNEEESRILFDSESAVELGEKYVVGTLPPLAQATLSDFFETFGMRGLGEVDMGRRRWREDPWRIITTIKSYFALLKDNAADKYSPEALFIQAREGAEELFNEICEHIKQNTWKFSLRRWWLLKNVRKHWKIGRGLSGLRESPKFYMVQIMGVVRSRLLEISEKFVEMGILDEQEDIFCLYFEEIKQLALKIATEESFADLEPVIATKKMIKERKLELEREKRRKQIPGVLVGDGRAFYEEFEVSNIEGGTMYSGTAASPGFVEGFARVVIDPAVDGAELKHREILVCAGTDPSWTPLFLNAGGLITEVGGIMTHGSVVAREYGVPAVVGVSSAVNLIKTGDKVRVDGSKGVIVVLKE